MEVLKDRRDFLRLRAQGKRIRVNHWLLINLQASPSGHFRCGWTLTKKVGSAVTRNKLKRWCREFFRAKEKLEQMPAVEMNVIFCSAGSDFYKRMSYPEFRKAADAGWKKITKFNKKDSESNRQSLG